MVLLVTDIQVPIRELLMNLRNCMRLDKRVLMTAILGIALFQISPLCVRAQNLGGAPAVNKAVQGETAAQPEGTLLNVVNWVGNVIAPLLAVGCVVMAVVSYASGRGVARWAVTAIGLLLISGLTRLIEFWIANGTAGVQ